METKVRDRARTALVAVLTIIGLVIPHFADADTRINALADTEQHAVQFGFSHADVVRFRAYGASIGACGDVVRSFPDMNELPRAETILRVIHRHRQCRTGLEAAKARLGVLRVEDSLHNFACYAYALQGRDADAEPDCTFPSSVPTPKPIGR